MTENNESFDIKSLLQYKKTITTLSCAVISTILTILYDIVNIYPVFWFEPLMLGVIAGIVIGNASAGLYSLVGAILGRLIAFTFMIFTIPDFLATIDQFMLAIGSFIGITLPGGPFFAIFLSLVITGLFAMFGGIATGSAVKIVIEYMNYNREKSTEPETVTGE